MVQRQQGRQQRGTLPALLHGGTHLAAVLQAQAGTELQHWRLLLLPLLPLRTAGFVTGAAILHAAVGCSECAAGRLLGGRVWLSGCLRGGGMMPVHLGMDLRGAAGVEACQDRASQTKPVLLRMCERGRAHTAVKPAVITAAS